MSKHPEKFIKDKELFKELSKEKEIKEGKEHKEKEFKEHKDKPEKEHKEKDIKEHKDKPEKEIKEIIKDYKEVKEIEKIQKDKDIEKIQKDKDVEKVQKEKDKDAETQPVGDPIQPLAAIHKFHGKEHIEKVQKDKDHEKGVKELDAFQKGKEMEGAAQLQGVVQQLPHAQNLFKFHKDFKEFKIEKHEKFEKHEKIEIKEIKEWDVIPLPHLDPGGPVEQRIAALEATIAQLIHFIPAELRPDLSTGALAEEKRAQAAKSASDKPTKEASPADKDKSDKK